MVDADTTKQAIIDAALDEFTANGYAAASLNTVIERAGISKGSFYYRFPSKEALYLSLIDYVVTARLEFVRERMIGTVRESGGDLFDVLKSQAKLAVEFTLSNPKLTSFTLKVANEGVSMPLAAKVKERLSGKLDQTLVPLLRNAMDRGELRKDLGEAYTAKLIGHLLFSFGPLFVPPDNPPDREQVFADLDRYFDFIENGLRSPKQPKVQEGSDRE